jgi:hypothetical protein
MMAGASPSRASGSPNEADVLAMAMSRCLKLGQVAACAEVVARTRENDGADVVQRGEMLEGVDQLAHHLEAHGIADVWTIKRE